MLETYAARSIYPNHGQRGVNECHPMQSASDIFLGWTKNQLGRHFYVRPPRGMKMGFQSSIFIWARWSRMPTVEDGRWGGRMRALAQPRRFSGYLGKSDSFDTAIVAFAKVYADQSERDHAIFKKAVRSGRAKAVME